LNGAQGNDGQLGVQGDHQPRWAFEKKKKQTNGGGGKTREKMNKGKCSLKEGIWGNRSTSEERRKDGMTSYDEKRCAKNENERLVPGETEGRGQLGSDHLKIVQSETEGGKLKCAIRVPGKRAEDVACGEL